MVVRDVVTVVLVVGVVVGVVVAVALEGWSVDLIDSAGYRDVYSQRHSRRVARLWGQDVI